VLCQQPTGDAALTASRDSVEQAAIRQSMPVLSHRCFTMPCLDTAVLE